MKKSYSIICIEIVLNIVLFLALFYSKFFNRIVISVILTVFAVIIYFLFKKQKMLSINKRQATFMMGGFSIINISLFYAMGLYFGYASSIVKFSLWSIVNYIIPITIMIISSEIIRYALITNGKKSSKILMTISMIIIDLIIYSQVYNFASLQDFLKIVGFVLFASISSNLLYTYVCNSYGYVPVIIYRLVTELYKYIIPIIPDVHIYLRAVLRMIYPYLIYLGLEFLFGQKIKATEYKNSKRNKIYSIIILIIAILITMLISCKFWHGILVIGSESMTGALNKGDAVVFEKYDNQEIQEGQVIIFLKNNLRTVHRIVDINEINGNLRIYTKGDANTDIDEGFIETKDIVGICNFRLQYIGYPTLWINNLFKKK